MGFWGMSQAGKDAQNATRQQATWDTQQRDWWQGAASEGRDRGNALFQQVNDYWGNRGGAPSTAAITQTGEEAAPWRDAFGRMQSNLNNTRDAWGRTIRGGTVQGNIMTNLGMQMDNINNNQAAVQGQIDTGFNGARDRETSTTGDVRNNINSSYDTASSTLGNAYTDARQSNNAAYADVLSRVGSTFGAMKTDAQKLRPGGEFQQAQTARSFAPNIASMAASLRRAGVDPNSVQAANMIGNVETSRARAMDDRAAASTSEYVNTINGIRAGELGAATGAITGRLNNDLSLGTAGAGAQANLALGRGNATTTEMQRYLAAMNGLDLSQMQGTIGNLDSTMQRQNANLDARSQADVLGRDMANQDFQTEAGLNDQANAMEMNGLNLQDNAWNRGMQWNQWNQQGQDMAQQQRQQLMAQQFQNMGNAGQMAAGAGASAAGLNNGIYQQEAANAGWGTRLLGSLAGSAIGAFAGGGFGGIGGMFGGGAARAATPALNVSGNTWNNPIRTTSSLFQTWRP